MKYFITIVDNATLSVKNLVRDTEEELNNVIESNLGGRDNLLHKSISMSMSEYQMSGHTVNKSHSYSILCVLEDSQSYESNGR